MGIMMLSRLKHVQQTLVSEPSAFVVEMAIEKLKRHKSPNTDETPA
jgi:hypothetical protein